jgi:hypothetical protein
LDIDKLSDKPTTSVTFQVSAAGLDPDIISHLLSLTPNHTHREGDYPRNNPKYSPYKHGMWELDSKLPAEESFSVHLEGLLFILEPKQQEILALSKRNYVIFYCGLFSQIGFELSPTILQRIGNLGASLGVSVYP